MKIEHTNSVEKIDLPFQFLLSFDKVFEMYEKYTEEEYTDHPFHESAKTMIAELQKYPDLINGFSDLSLIEKYQDQIELLLNPLFPEALLTNEIKAASIPFSFTSFMFTTRFENILEAAGEDFELNVRNFEDDKFYISACTMILSMVYGYNIDLTRPFFFDIPDKNGEIRNYRVAFNADLGMVIPTEKAPKITEEDYRLLLDSMDNIEIWKEKFPLGSYIFKGFGVMNLFDVTTDETIVAIRTDLLRSDENLINDLQKNLGKFYNIKDLMLGISVFELSEDDLKSIRVKKTETLILRDEPEFLADDFFCEHILDSVFKKLKSVAISDVEKYGDVTNKNRFYQKMNSKGIGSIILIPVKSKNNNDLGVIEIASPRPFELNSINQEKLKDIMPVFQSAMERASKEHQNILEATIQEFYTSIHPTVKWRFNAAAEKYHQAIHEKRQHVKLDEIVFNDVYPLFGQSDIKDSSVARNRAIRNDLVTQLTLAVSVLEEACKSEQLPIYEELVFRINQYLKNVKKGLRAGDEIGILDFLKSEIYPAFSHINKVNKRLKELVDVYMNRLDSELGVVYEQRKDYENSITLLNETIADYIDLKQEEAQKMFPHYFERYKTDGVEYNIYIGQSLVEKKKFEKLYLQNMRLWQLKLMYEVENLAFSVKKEMKYELQIASLILVHNNPLSIKFRMDEKQFDVDGAYNIRYEIIKKRIDKAYIRGTKERLTVPGKIAIVYSQDKDAREYNKYIKYLQSKKLLGQVEALELEDLQGMSGLKALRVDVIYQENYDQHARITIDELIKEISN